MRKVVLGLTICLSALTAGAQRVEIGLNGGFLLHTSYGGINEHSLGETFWERTPIGSYGSIKASFILKNWQVGIAADKYHTKVKMSPGTFGIGDPTLYTLTPHLFGNRIFKLPKGFLYAGIHAGICTGKTTTPTDVSNYNLEAKFNGICAGWQLGYTYYFLKHLGLNIEISTRYQNIDHEAPDKGGVYQYVHPVSLGLRYSL